MFDQDQQKYLEVIITTSDGSDLEGKLLCGLNGTIDSALNTDNQFIKLKDEDGDISFLSKIHIAKISHKKSNNQSVPKLKVNNLKASNWTEILDVRYQSSPVEVKNAYHILAKRYHPDLFTIDMPLEVKEYANTMLSRINLAYEQYKLFKQAA